MPMPMGIMVPSLVFTLCTLQCLFFISKANEADSFYSPLHVVNDIEGNIINLDKYRGKVTVYSEL